MRSRFTLLPLLLAAAVAAGSLAVPAQAAEKSARQLFGHKTKPAALPSRAIGFYSHGCLAGAVMLPPTGPAWQAMRLSRNRNWGHPRLVALVQRLATESKELDGWPGLLVGDLAQPRGGPMLSDHRSHQVGLDADIWLMPKPDRKLSRKERETFAPVPMTKKNGTEVIARNWKAGHVRLLKRAAEYPEVERIFVHPAIKKALCEAAGPDAKWLWKIRPLWRHYYHFHVRIKCPPGSANCRKQKPVAENSGCGKELKDWLALISRPAKPAKPGAKPKKREIKMANLPKECRAVLAADDARPAQFAAGPPPVIRAGVLPLPFPRQKTGTLVPSAKPRSEATDAVPLPDRKPASASAAPATRAQASPARSSPNLPWLRGIASPPLPDRKPN